MKSIHLAMPVLDIRLENDLKVSIERIAEKGETTVSEVVRNLVVLGIGIMKEGGVDVLGPFGLSRPFAEIEFGGEPTRIGVRLEEELTKELEKVFKDPARVAARKALRFGVVALGAENIKIKGKIFGISRPLATLRPPEITDERSRKALKTLQKFLKKKKQ